MTSAPDLRQGTPRRARRRPTVPALLWWALLAGWMPLGAVALDPDRPSAVALALYVLLLLAAMLVTFLRGAGHGIRRDPAGVARSVGTGTAALTAGAVLILTLWISSAIVANTSGWFSAVLISLAMAGQFCGLSFLASPFTLSLRS